MTKEKQPITANSTVPFPSTAVAAEAAHDDAGTHKGDEAWTQVPEPAGAAPAALPTPAPEPLDSGDPKMSADRISVFYGEKQALKDVSIRIHDDKVTAFIGPSGCGK